MDYCGASVDAMSEVFEDQDLTGAKPLAPDSIMLRYDNDWRIFLVVSGTGLLQLMHPAISAGVIQHSRFFDEPYERVFRSIPPIRKSKIAGAEAPGTAVAIRDFHRDIKGVDADGNRYHALDPEVYFWAHATFINADMVCVNTFHHQLTQAERAEFYENGKQWYQLYGVSDRAMPDTLEEFDQYWDYMCNEVLVDTEAARWVVNNMGDAQLYTPLGVPKGLWRKVGPAITNYQSFFTAATMPPVARERLGLQFTSADERSLRRRIKLLQMFHPVLNPVISRIAPKVTERALSRSQRSTGSRE